jgi:transposase
MAYDKKFRQKVLEYLDKGHTQKEASARFSISTSTIFEWKSLLKENDTLEPKKRETPWRKIDPEKLKKYVEKHPDAFQQEMADAFSVRLSSMQKALKRLGITHKKNYHLQGN